MTPARPGVLILHHAPSGAAADPATWRASDAGVLAEVAAVAAALDRLGVPHRTAAVARLADLPAVLAAAPEATVFNLVEDFDGATADAAAVPAVCRAFGKAFTGNDSPCLALALDKGRTKAVLQAAGLPCPAGVVVPPGEKVPAAAKLPRGPYIVKPAAADASEGIDAASVVQKAGAALTRAVARIHREFRQAAVIEQFIDGRELNVSVLHRGMQLAPGEYTGGRSYDGGPPCIHGGLIGCGGDVEVLPIAEIDFSAFPDGQPRIVDYAAKWLPETFAYNNTPRILPARLTARHAEAVRRLARAAWDALGCRGYARVDFRLDARGRPFILEVNPNPDISPDAGFAAALAAAGIPYEAFVAEMIDYS